MNHRPEVRHGIDWFRREQERAHQAALDRGVKPISKAPGAGIGSFAEDDPETHKSFRQPRPDLEGKGEE